MANAGSRPGGRVLSCYAAKKEPKKRTLLAGPAGYPHSGSTHLHSAAQKGRKGTYGVRPSPQPSDEATSQSTKPASGHWLSLQGRGSKPVAGSTRLSPSPSRGGPGWGWVTSPSGSLSGRQADRGCPVWLSERSEFQTGRFDCLERRHRRRRRDRGSPFLCLLSFGEAQRS